MIQPNELRVGNWLYNKQLGTPFQISGVHNIITKDDYGKTDGLWLFGDTPDKDCEPISLTEDILSKCGFVKSKYKDEEVFILELQPFPLFLVKESSSWVLKREVVQNIYLSRNDSGEKDYDGCFRILSDLHQKRIEYLHQLQNLYFALTGKELEIHM